MTMVKPGNGIGICILVKSQRADWQTEKQQYSRYLQKR
jgi:hypothetical protein